MRIKINLWLCGLAGMGIISCSGKNDGGTPYIAPVVPPTDKNWTFETTASWADEFTNTGKPDSTKWGYDIGGSGWGNNELEYYTNAQKNANVANGVLSINAIKEPMGGMNYTSARMQSINKFDFLYGRIEVRAKLPEGTGTWPAIWMLPSDYTYGNWPNSGEFDIMEHVGYDPNVIHVSALTQQFNFKLNNGKTGVVTVTDAFKQYHLYRVDWTPYAIRGYVDDNLVLAYINDGTGSAEWPFDKKFHMMLNVAIGGDWGGTKGVDNSIFPTAMVVDYVRYYKMIDK